MKCVGSLTLYIQHEAPEGKKRANALRISDLLEFQVEHFSDDNQHIKRRFWINEQKRGKRQEVVVNAIASGHISGGLINPAFSFGVSVLGISSWSDIWIYLVAQFLGGAAAAGMFLYLNPDDK